MDQHFCPYCMTPVKPGESCPVCGLTAGTYTPAPHHLPPGTILNGRYLLGRVLGEGGFGITYIGCDLRLELKVAVKEYFPTDKVTRFADRSLTVSYYAGAAAAQYEQGRGRFLYEARTMAKMDKQPSIVSVRDYFEANNTAYIIMEYVEGTNFKELVAQRGGRIPAAELLQLIEPLFFALSEMHKLGLIHRDISPDNLMLEHGHVRLLDFGCAREATGSEATMTVALKHGYAPIEQYNNKGHGPWTDVYALSATIYYCLTGKRPPQSMDRLCGDELILPRKLGVDLTEQQEKALLYGMGIRPRRRYQTIDELHTALYQTGVTIPDAERPGLDPGFQPPEPEDPSSSAPAQEPACLTGAQDDSGQKAPAAAEAEKTEPLEQAPSEAQAEEAEASSLDLPAPRKPFYKKPAFWANCAALVIGIVILCVSLLPGKGAPAEPAPDAPDGPVSVQDGPDPAQEEPAQPSEEADDLFVHAVHLDDREYRRLPELLADNSVSAVIIDVWQPRLTEPLTINKPVRVAAGGEIGSYAPITVTGGGCLEVAGNVYLDAPLRTDGGSVHVLSGGQLHSAALFWLTRQEELTVDADGVCPIYDDRQSGRNCLILDEAALFADAVEVTTREELLEAQNTASAIIIAADLTLDETASSVPVRINEGVTLTVTGEHNYCTYATTLVNHGTIRGGAWFGGSGFTCVNYGLIEGAIWMGAFSMQDAEPSGNFLNYGALRACGHISGGSFYNLGVMESAIRGNNNLLRLSCENFINNGALTAVSNSSILLGGYMGMTNNGSIDVQSGAQFTSAVHLCQTSTGALRLASDSELINRSHLELCGTVEIDPAAAVHNEGLVQRGEKINWNPQLREQDQHLGHAAVFSYDDALENTPSANVDNESLLRGALKSTYYTRIYVTGDIELTEDLVIDKQVIIENGGLHVNGHRLTVSSERGQILHTGLLDLAGGELVIQNGIVVAQLTNVGKIFVNGGILLSRIYEDFSGSVTLANGGWMIPLSNLYAHGAKLSIQAGGVLRTSCDLELYDSVLEIGEYGELLASTAAFRADADSDVAILEHGVLELLDSSERRPVQMDCALENSGWTTLSGDSIYLYGPVTNSGTLMFAGQLIAPGGIENSGTIYALWDARLGAMVTGNQPIQKNEWVDRNQ